MSNWKLTEEENSSFVYQLNSMDTNRWWFGIQAGFDNDNKRTTEEELHKVALKVRAAEEMYVELERIHKLITQFSVSGFNPLSQPEIADEIFRSQGDRHDVLRKARGELK